MIKIKQTYKVVEIFTAGNAQEYLGEDVKLVENILQCADLARDG